VVQPAFQSAYICPLIKKSGLDEEDAKNYRLISNLPVASKLLERLVAQQLIKYLSDHNLLPDRQSAYRVFRSTETVIAHVLSDILTAMDKGDIAALTLLDLSAAFDTVDHATLLRRLQISFGLGGSALSWFHSYLSQRRQHVVHQSNSSPSSDVEFAVPQGSVLGPILFIMYMADVTRIVERHGLSVQQYADDTQLYGVCHPSNSASLCRDLGDCMSSVASWMSANRLQLNAAKTEFMWCVPPRRRHHLPTDQLTVGSVSVAPVDSVRDLGVLLNSDISMDAHLTRLASSCFGVLINLFL